MFHMDLVRKLLQWPPWIKCVEDIAYCPFIGGLPVSLACLPLDTVYGCCARVAMKGLGWMMSR